jgi:large subunit ribosomal protein L4
MAKATVYDWNKKEVGSVELSDAVFGCEVRTDILHQVVRWQLACRRQGTHKTKTRAFVSGGGRKPFKQKGTGNARQGSTRSPLNPGGAVIFGPQPRDYSYTLPKKVRQAGLRSALSHLAKNGQFYVVEDMVSDGKTKDISAKLKSFGVEKAVLLDSAENPMFQRASRNLGSVRYYSVDGMNAYDLLKYDAAIVTKSALDRITQRCGVES